MFIETHVGGTLPRYSAKRNLHRANFFCHAPEAEQVWLIGDFNKWQPNAIPDGPPARRPMDGQLGASHGYHEYVFLVDGKRVLDPNATGKAKDCHNEPVSLLAVS